MTAWPDGTALWLRGTNEVVDGKEGLPPSISPLNTSCQGLRDRLAPTVGVADCNSARRTQFYLEPAAVLESWCVTKEPKVLRMNVFGENLYRSFWGISSRMIIMEWGSRDKVSSLTLFHVEISHLLLNPKEFVDWKLVIFPKVYLALCFNN